MNFNLDFRSFWQYVPSNLWSINSISNRDYKNAFPAVTRSGQARAEWQTSVQDIISNLRHETDNWPAGSLVVGVLEVLSLLEGSLLHEEAEGNLHSSLHSLMVVLVDPKNTEWLFCREVNYCLVQLTAFMKYVTSDKTPNSENHATLQDDMINNRNDKCSNWQLSITDGEYYLQIINSC